MLLKSLGNVAEGLFIIFLKTRNFFDSHMLIIITLSLVRLYFKSTRTPLLSRAFIAEWMDSWSASTDVLSLKLIRFQKSYFIVYNCYFIIIYLLP